MTPAEANALIDALCKQLFEFKHFAPWHERLLELAPSTEKERIIENIKNGAPLFRDRDLFNFSLDWFPNRRRLIPYYGFYYAGCIMRYADDNNLSDNFEEWDETHQILFTLSYPLAKDL